MAQWCAVATVGLASTRVGVRVGRSSFRGPDRSPRREGGAREGSRSRCRHPVPAPSLPYGRLRRVSSGRGVSRDDWPQRRGERLPERAEAVVRERSRVGTWPSDTQCRTGDQSLTGHGGLPVPVPTFAPALQCPVPASPGLQPWDPVPVRVLGQGLRSQSEPVLRRCLGNRCKNDQNRSKTLLIRRRSSLFDIRP